MIRGVRTAVVWPGSDAEETKKRGKSGHISRGVENQLMRQKEKKRGENPI